MSDDVVVLKTFGNHFEADVAKSALEAAGIQSIIRTDDAGGMRPHLWTTLGVALCVRTSDAERAQEVLAADAQA